MTVTAIDTAITGGAGARYARALFELAAEAGALKPVESDVDTLGAALAESGELRAALKSPVYTAGDKAAALNALAGKLGLGELTARFVAVAARNGRAGDLEDAVRAFKALAARERGEVSAGVISADALTQAQLKELKAALKTALGKDVDIRTQVRPDILGGLIVKVGSRMFDSSLRTKLEGLRKTMKEA